MIYLKPVGGLCNRMRSIDSAIALCKAYQRDLTVFWTRDVSLNASFADLFTLATDHSITVKVVDCPVGYPEYFLPKSDILWKTDPRFNSQRWIFARKLKNMAKGRRLTGELKGYLNQLCRIPKSHVITNEELDLLYPVAQPGSSLTTREMDGQFLTVIDKLVLPIFKDAGQPAYIASCYRMHPLTDAYSAFIPKDPIRHKIKTVAEAFTPHTLGIHIRRSDHVIARAMSTLDKFIRLLDETLQKSPNANFFLSTDDAETKAGLIAKYGDKILYNEVNSYDRNNSDAVIDAVVDLYCLSHTSHIYGSHQSSFSQTAADIGGIKEEAVI